MIKQGTFATTQARFRHHLESTKNAAKQAELSTTQGNQEMSIGGHPSSDPEVKDITGQAGVPADPAKTLADRGVEVDQKLPGTSEPPKEEKKTEETSPSSPLKEGALNSIDAIQNRLAANLIKKAQAKRAAEIGDEGGLQPIPSRGKDLSLGTGEGTKGEPTGSQTAPKIQGAEGVTQTDVPANHAPKKLDQGTSEEKVGQIMNVDELCAKVARFTANLNQGRAMAHTVISTLKQAMLTPEQVELQKQAAAVEAEIVAKTANALTTLGVDRGILSTAQAEALMKVAGFQENPLSLAMSNLQHKLAQLGSTGCTLEQAHDYILKCAAMDPAAMQDPGAGGADPSAGGAPDGTPPAPQELQGAIQQLLQQLHQAVQSGQMTDEEALQILKQHGLPVDEMLAGVQGGAGGGMPPDAGGAPGGDPGAAAGATPEAAAMQSAMGDGGAGAAPQPPDIGGQAPVEADPAPQAPSAPSAPSPDIKPKHESEKKEHEGKEKKDDKKDDDKDDKREKEALLAKVAAAFGYQAAADLQRKMAAGEIPMGAEDPTAGGSVASAPEGAGGPPPDGAGAPGAAPGAGGGALEQILNDLAAAVQSGQIPPEVAQQIAQELAGAGGGGAGAPPDAGGPPPGAGGPPPGAGAPPMG